MRHQGVYVLQAHPLADRPLHPRQTHPVLALAQLAYGADAAVAEMVNVIAFLQLIFDPHQLLDAEEDILFGQGALLNRRFQAQAGVDLVAPHLGKIVSRRIIEELVEEILGNVNSRRAGGPQTAVYLHQCLRRVADLVRRQRLAEGI